ncbi:hypothetical protein [Pandoraea apista]|uniref:Zinc ribbon domain-containing protein n=1 Tax=Pandoraea apista TaxID=93218 RepID=A0A5E5P9B9_9BURK|nr:hypothetical protein [Pandoraea apista]AJF00432.1 hypothetical protein SG18_23745 [Pandoraea apista]AKH74615.1 hypothetical protein XM39_23925 [Pandoraea apista]AKI63165.1 hypothetical protein AA956_17245 [Pandoraea apista]AVF41428.1 hypothetical protein AL486_18290 [Pandoraea apista]OXS92548.1 hypothetical protein B7H01_16500 [Pandoraea apista]
MTLKFRNPANGDVVEITYMSCVAAFFLGPLYLLAYGFAWHALIWVALAIGPALVWRESVLAISLPLTCLLYSLIIHPMLVARLRANGWVPTFDDAVPGPGQRGYDAYGDAPSTGRASAGMRLAPTLSTLGTAHEGGNVGAALAAQSPAANESASLSLAADEKSCPFCAETIKRQALRCRHCLANLPATSQ